MLDKHAEGVREPSKGLDSASDVHFGPFLFDRELHTLRREGEEIALPLRSLLVLEVLLRHPGRTIPRERLIDEVWRGGFVTDTSLTEAVSRLRQALGDGARQPRYIQTIHGRGYKLIAPLGGSPEASVEVPTVGPASGRNWMRASIAASLLFAALAWTGVSVFGPDKPVPRPVASSEGSADEVDAKRGEGARPMVQLAEVTMSGEPRTLYRFPPLPLDDLSVDPIGGRLAFSMNSGEGSDIWMLHPDRGALQRIASGGHFSDPVWTLDGRGLALAHTGRHSIDLMYGEPGSGQEMEVLLEAPFDQFPESWSRDGRSLIYSERHPETGFDLWLLRRQDDGRWLPTPLVQTNRHEAFGAISPDGRYVAYVSKGDGAPNVFALDLSHRQPQIRVSRDGGRYPFWSVAGDRLHYLEGDVVWTLDTDQLEGGVQPSARRSTPVTGIRLAAASSIADGFVVAVLDGLRGAKLPGPQPLDSGPLTNR